MKARNLLFLFLVMASALKLRANDTSWDYNPYAFQYDMSVYVELSTIDGKNIADAADYQIAAFCDEDCRGIAEKITVGEHEYVYLRIRSNKTEGETINFKVKNSSNGKIAKVVETIEFQSQQTIGYPSAPFAINALNQYKLTYYVDEEVYEEYDLDYGTTIIPEEAPTKDGYKFSGWGEIPETMPDHDVYVYGTFETTTSILNIKADACSNVICDLFGRRIDAPVANHIYIQNGRKFMAR